MTGRPRLARSMFWATVDNWTAQAAQLVTFLWVGNILGPTAVGVMGIALILVVFAQQLLVDSLSEPLVQRAAMDPRHVEATFWALLALGVGMMLVIEALAGPIAAFFGEPLVEDAVRVLALTFVLFGPSSTFQAVLQRDLRFRALAFRSFAVHAVATPACIAMAHAGFGVWSLIFYNTLIHVLEFVALAVALRWVPGLRFSRRHFAEVWSYGKHNLKFRIVGYIATNAERVVIGYFLGPTALGLFSLARRIVDSIEYALTGVMSGVMLAAFSRAQDDRTALGALLGQTTSLAGVVIVPAFVGLAAVAPVLVEALLRPQWLPIVELVQILSLYGLLCFDAYFHSTLLRSLGRVDLVYRFGLLVAVLQLVAFLAAVRFGLEAMAWSIVVVNAASLPVLYRMSSAYVPSAVAGRLAAYGPPVLAAAAMAVAVLGLSRWLGALEPPARLVAVVAWGFLTYWLVLAVLRPRAVFGILRLVLTRASVRRL